MSYFFTCHCFFGGGLLDLLILFLCQNYLYYFCLTQQPSLDLRNPLYCTRFEYRHSFIVLGIDQFQIYTYYLLSNFQSCAHIYQVLIVCTHCGTLKSLLLGAGGFCYVFSFSSSVWVMQLLVLLVRYVSSQSPLLTHFSPVTHFYTPRKRFSDVFRGYANVTLD